MRHSIIFSGSNPISLDRDEHLIIDEMNQNLERFYFNLVKVVSLNQINTDTLEIVIERQERRADSATARRVNGPRIAA